jgi:hypothetical protein
MNFILVRRHDGSAITFPQNGILSVSALAFSGRFFFSFCSEDETFLFLLRTLTLALCKQKTRAKQAFFAEKQ